MHNFFEEIINAEIYSENEDTVQWEVNFGKINSGEVNFGKNNSRDTNFGKNNSNYANFRDFETDEEISNKVKFGKINFREETDNDVFFEKTKFGHKNFREVRRNINNVNSSKINNAKTNFDNLSKFEQVEVTLVETVKNFEGKANRFQKTWSREFIAQLIQIMVLYRDVVHQNPSNSYNALKRIRQITELVNEIKKNL